MTDEDVMSISRRIMEKNREAYGELADIGPAVGDSGGWCDSGILLPERPCEKMLKFGCEKKPDHLILKVTS